MRIPPKKIDRIQICGDFEQDTFCEPLVDDSYWEEELKPVKPIKKVETKIHQRRTEVTRIIYCNK